MRPTVYLGYVDETGAAWSPKDRELAKALLLHERSACHGCGNPVHESHDPDKLGWYNVERVTCTACFAIAKAQEEDKGDMPGTKYLATIDDKYVRRTP